MSAHHFVLQRQVAKVLFPRLQLRLQSLALLLGISQLVGKSHGVCRGVGWGGGGQGGGGGTAALAKPRVSILQTGDVIVMQMKKYNSDANPTKFK